MQAQLQTIFNTRNALAGATPFFEFVNFQDKDTLFNYIGSSKYGLDEHKAVCFGFQVHENSASDYEVELFFNALPPREFMSIPD